MKLQRSSPNSASKRSATFNVSWRTVLMASVASSGRKSLRALTVRPYEASEDHFDSMKRSSGETDSVRSADNGRNEIVLQRRQVQCNSRGLGSLKVPNRVRNERVV
jgi:hypothetical protein